MLSVSRVAAHSGRVKQRHENSVERVEWTRLCVWPIAAKYDDQNNEDVFEQGSSYHLGQNDVRQTPAASETCQGEPGTGRQCLLSPKSEVEIGRNFSPFWAQVYPLHF